MRKKIFRFFVFNSLLAFASIVASFLVWAFSSNLLLNIAASILPFAISCWIDYNMLLDESSREVDLCFLRSAYKVLNWHKAACYDTIQVNLNREKAGLSQTPPYQFAQSFSVYELEIRETLLQMYSKYKVDALCNGWKSNDLAFSEKVSEVRAKVKPTVTECDVYHIPLNN